MKSVIVVIKIVNLINRSYRVDFENT